MNWEQYKELMYDEACDWIDESYPYYNVEDWDIAFEEMELVITGNGNGSRTCNAYKAEQDVRDVVWDDEFQDFVTNCMCVNFANVMRDPETADIYACIAALDAVYLKVQSYWYNKFDNEGEENVQ